jgi:hypothetical protein
MITLKRAEEDAADNREPSAAPIWNVEMTIPNASPAWRWSMPPTTALGERIYSR